MRMLMGTALLACFSCALARSLPSELRDFHHRSWTSEAGLGTVLDVQQCSQGYLWLTTPNGVFRFDGARFQSIDEVTLGAVHNKDIDTAFMASDNTLWLATRAHGLIRWKNGEAKAFPDRRCTPGVKTGGMVEDSDGSLWIQASAGLSRFRAGKCEAVSDQPGAPKGFPANLLIDSRGILWVKMTSGDLYSLSADRTKFTRIASKAFTQASLTFLREAPDKSIWLSDERGLRQVVDSNGTPAAVTVSEQKLPLTERIRTFAFAPDGSLWAASGRGIERFDVRERRVLHAGEGQPFTTSQGLSSDVVWKILFDREGAAWVATNAGLDQLRRNLLRSVPRPPSPEYQLGVIAGDEGSVWIGSRGLPLTRIAADGTATSYPKTHGVLSLRRDLKGNIWSAGPGEARLWRTEGTKLVPVRYPHEDLEVPVASAVDRNGEVWISTLGPNIYHRVGSEWRRENETLGRKPGVLGAMSGDAEGNVWFAFSNKLVEWDGQSYHRYSFADGTLGLSVTTLKPHGNRVWMGGLGGVVLFRDGAFHKLNFRNGELPGRLSGVLESRDGALWTNGYSGIVHVPAEEMQRFLADPSYAVSAERLEAMDGLPGLVGERFPEPSLAESSDGRLWFATTKGIVWLDPTALAGQRNLTLPPVHIMTVNSDGREYLSADGLRLPPRSRNVRFDYAALSLAVPERVRFRYRLEGAEQEWHDAGTRRQAFYNDLPPGSYRFRVVACNNNGVWNEQGDSLVFAVAPAFYQTWWFRGLIVTALAGAIWLAVWLRIRRIRQQYDLRLAERLDERVRIARELHDTLLQSVVGLMLQVQHAADHLSDEDPNRRMLGAALDRAEQVMQEGRARVRDLRTQQGSGDRLIEELNDVAQQFQDLSPARFHLSVRGKVRVLKQIVQEELTLVGREALTNAFTHAHALTIQATVRYDRTALVLSVDDDGDGIAPEVLEVGERADHWGLPGMRERARRLNGDLRITSRKGDTRVELRVPACMAYRDRPAVTRLWSRLWANSGATGI